MAGYNGGSDPSGNQFTHELSYTNYSYTPDERNQQNGHGTPPYHSSDTEDYQNNSSYFNSRASLGVNVNDVNNTSATTQQYTGYDERDNLALPASVDQNRGQQGRRHEEVAEIGALRAYHRALKADKMKLMKATKEIPDDKMADMEPVVVTFVDKKNGIEYDAFGQIIPPAPFDDRTQSAAPEDSDDAILTPHEQASEGTSDYSPYGHDYPSPYYPQYQSQDQSISQQNVQTYPAHPTYGYDQPPANTLHYDPQVPPPQYPGQPYTEWQGGTFYPPNSNQTVQQYVYTQPATPVSEIPDYMACSVVVFLCCCWPFGLAAIRLARAAKDSARQGNYAQAMEHAQASRAWNITGVFLGIVAYVVMGVSIYFRIQSLKSH
ncbi:unnamed protein product [Lymnaea stagnalis]|uniref:Uncharacterized protein n=1 Tax=Lymnaea stagnalis TaxID=6523 RepID=A0AAV2H6Z5_LYMST